MLMEVQQTNEKSCLDQETTDQENILTYLCMTNKWHRCEATLNNIWHTGQ